MSMIAVVALVALGGTATDTAAATEQATAATLSRDRCDAKEGSAIDNILYRDAQTEKVDQIIQPRATFTPEGKIVCDYRGNMEEPRKILLSQVESGVTQGFGYRIAYQYAYAKVTEAGKQDDILADEYWTANCDVDSMTDEVSCYIHHERLFLWYESGRWRVHIGDGRNYPGSEIVIRFGDAEAIRGKEPAFSAEQSRRIVESLASDPRVRTRFQKWPSGTGEDDFQARGFNLAVALVKWLREMARP